MERMDHDLTPRDAAILRAAKTIFIRFGVAKTTMTDIAVEAGVSRQTVYNAFPGKPELLRATTRLANLDAQDEMRAAWSEANARGEGVAVVDGQIVENLHIATAKATLAKMAAIEPLQGA